MNAHQDTLFPRTPRLDTSDVQQLRATLRDYFHATFSRYEQLFEVLTCDEAWTRKPITLRHPLIFYFGHTATFFVNKLLLAGLIGERLDPRLESMFAVGVDEMSWDDLNDANYAWPTVQAVFEKMADIVRQHLQGHAVHSLYLTGGSCALPGVRNLFAQEFPQLQVFLPSQPLFLTPLSIAAYRPVPAAAT